jgi:hypothetical protein
MRAGSTRGCLVLLSAYERKYVPVDGGAWEGDPMMVLPVVLGVVLAFALILGLPVYLDRRAMRTRGKFLFTPGNLAALWIIGLLGCLGRFAFGIGRFFNQMGMQRAQVEVLPLTAQQAVPVGAVMLLAAVAGFVLLTVWNGRRVGGGLAKGGAFVEALVLLPGVALPPGFLILLVFSIGVLLSHLRIQRVWVINP